MGRQNRIIFLDGGFSFEWCSPRPPRPGPGPCPMGRGSVSSTRASASSASTFSSAVAPSGVCACVGGGESFGFVVGGGGAGSDTDQHPPPKTRRQKSSSAAMRGGGGGVCVSGRPSFIRVGGDRFVWTPANTLDCRKSVEVLKLVGEWRIRTGLLFKVRHPRMSKKPIWSQPRLAARPHVFYRRFRSQTTSTFKLK